MKNEEKISIEIFKQLLKVVFSLNFSFVTSMIIQIKKKEKGWGRERDCTF